MLFVHRPAFRIAVMWVVTFVLWFPGASVSLVRHNQRVAAQERVAAEAAGRLRADAEAQAQEDAAAQFPDKAATIREQLDEIASLADDEAWATASTRTTALQTALAPLFASAIGDTDDVEAIRTALDDLHARATSGVDRLQNERRRRQAEARRPQPQLALLSARGYAEHGFHHVEGRVENVSGASLKNVTAVVTWYTAEDQFITTHDAIIDYNPVLPGQTSPFDTLGSTNPAMSRYKVQFKELLGGTLRTEDRR